MSIRPLLYRWWWRATHTRKPRAFWFRRWVCRTFGHRFEIALGAPWWTFGKATVFWRCDVCGVDKPS